MLTSPGAKDARLPHESILKDAENEQMQGS
jgi:hypothetical protein